MFIHISPSNTLLNVLNKPKNSNLIAILNYPYLILKILLHFNKTIIGSMGLVVPKESRAIVSTDIPNTLQRTLNSPLWIKRHIKQQTPTNVS